VFPVAPAFVKAFEIVLIFSTFSFVKSREENSNIIELSAKERMDLRDGFWVNELIFAESK